MNNLDQMHLADEIERHIENENENIQHFLMRVIESAQANIPNIPTMKHADIVDQIDIIKDFIVGVEAATQRKLALKRVLNKLNKIV